MPSPQEILADPNFHALPLGDRLKVMRTEDSNFAALPPKEQGTVLYQSAASLHPMPTEAQPEDQGFLPTIGHDIMALPGGVISAVTHPLDTLASATQARLALRPKAAQALKEGNYMGAAGYGLASMLPFVGPAAAQAGEEIGGGQPGQGAAHAAEVLAPFAMRIPEVRSAVLPSEETLGTAREFIKPKRWEAAKARYQAKQGGLATRPQAQPAAAAKTSVPLPPIQNEAASSAPLGPQTVDDFLAQQRAAAPIAPAGPPASLLDDIARGQTGKGFSKLDARGQAVIRDLASRIHAQQSSPIPESLPAPSPTAAAPPAGGLKIERMTPEIANRIQAITNKTSAHAVNKYSHIVDELATQDGLTQEQFKSLPLSQQVQKVNEIIKRVESRGKALDPRFRNKTGTYGQFRTDPGFLGETKAAIQAMGEMLPKAGEPYISPYGIPPP